MIPRFSNPHILPESSRIVTREELRKYEPSEDVNNEEDLDDVEIPFLTKRLRELVHSSIGDAIADIEDLQPKMKRRKIQSEQEETGGNDHCPETALPFRLLSSSTPSQRILLVPKPPPPVRSIEPEYEDNDVQAEERMRLAQSIAVTTDWVIQESKRRYHLKSNNRGEALRVDSIRLPIPPPTTLILERTQPPRCTRPPLSTLTSHSVPIKSHPSPAMRPDRPIVSFNVLNNHKGIRRARSRRRRPKHSPKEFPQPSFWKPDPAIRGKCIGYALGYPRSWGVDDSHRGNGEVKYERDTMRNGVYTDELGA